MEEVPRYLHIIKKCEKKTKGVLILASSYEHSYFFSQFSDSLIIRYIGK